MRTNQFKTHIASGNVRNSWKRWLFWCIVCVLVVLWTGGSLYAEIYKWRDETGTIRYSNKPPLDPSLILETIPTRRVPLVEDADGVVYYLNIPIENQKEDIASPAEITVSPEVLKELLKEAPAAAIQSSSQLPVDITALTVRLAEVENALTREIENRVKWEYDYTQAESFVKKLEKQNKTLRLALARMEKDLGSLRGAVIVSDRQLTALKNSAQPQQLAMLEGKVDDIQSYINRIVKTSDQRVAMVQTEIDTLKTTQGTKLETLNAKLDALELELETVNGLALSDKLAALATEVHSLKAQKQPAAPKNSPQPQQLVMLEGKVDDIQSYINNLVQTSDQRAAMVQTEIDTLKTTQGTKLETLNAKLDALELELDAMNGLALSDKLAALSKEIHQLEPQGQPDDNMRGRLASLEAEVEQLTDVLPASREVSDVKPVIAELMEKNSFMESVIKHQTNALKAQNKQIQAIEAKLAQLQMPGQFPEEQEVVEQVADRVEIQILSESSTSGIRVVPRKERVKPQEFFFMKWLRGDAVISDLRYPHAVIERKER